MDKKKIGILTYHAVPNFGANLQALSTVGFINSMGHEAILLNWYPVDLQNMYEKRIPVEQIDAHSKFTASTFPLTNICRTENDLVAEINRNNIDGIIVGSDALFKYIPESKRKYFSKRKMKYLPVKVLSVEDLKDNPFFGSFYEKLERKIPFFAFSVSSQNCPYVSMNDKERSLANKYLSNFTDITVRDEWTKSMVENLTNMENVKITPDPVFSFNQNCYIHIPTKNEILIKFNLTSDYVLLSFRTKHLNTKYIKNIAKELQLNNLQPVAFPMPEGLNDYRIETKIPLPLSPIDWYALIKYSKGYIGERMHPIVVCLHNSVPFFCFDEYGAILHNSFFKKTYIKESSKTYHILSLAGLLDNLYSYKDKYKVPSVNEVIMRILQFDYKKCKEFAIKQQYFYKKEFEIIINRFK